VSEPLPDAGAPSSSGPLQGLRVVELAGADAASFAAMLLADMGAEVIRIQAPGAGRAEPRFDVLGRSRHTLDLDLAQPTARQQALELVARADVLVEGFLPGVMEQLGLGPEVCQALNPRLVYGRVTGWGQHGPMSRVAGQDINHVALSGALHAIGRAGEAPTVPLNHLGDFGGGGLLASFGLLCAVHEAGRSGRGQVVDVAASDGVALQSAMAYGLHAQGLWCESRGENRLDGGAHFYDTYACADGKFIAVGALEPQSYAELLERCGIADPLFVDQDDRFAWPVLKGRLARVFLSRTRAEWCSLLEGSAACVVPVLDWDEAPSHPHNLARQAFVDVAGVVQPAPAPRFSRTRAARPRLAEPAPDLAAALQAWGLGDELPGPER